MRTYQNPFQLIKQDFQQLSGALQSGDLSDAQTAYSNIQEVLQGGQGGSNASTNGNGPDTLQTDFGALGQALQSGNLSQAQSAFSQLESDFQTNNQANVGAGAGTQAADQYVPNGTQTETPGQQAQQDYTQLATALQSGSLANAQSAFAALEQLVGGQQNSGNGQTDATNSSNTITNDFNALGQALSAGDLTQAQSAFSQLQSDVQTADQANTPQASTPGSGTPVQGRHHHHHHHGGGGAAIQNAASTDTSTDTTNDTTTDTSNQTSAATGFNLTVNIYA